MKSEFKEASSAMHDENSKSVTGHVESVWHEPSEDMLYYV
jgi:hypothetical protein